MRRLSLFLLAVSLFSFSGCLQNFKESELEAENQSAFDVSLSFNGNTYRLESGIGTKSLANNIANTKDFRPDNYTYNTIVHQGSVQLAPGDVVELDASLSGNLDFTNKGKKVAITYFSTYEPTVDSTKDPSDSTKMIYTTTYKYKVWADVSEGWTE